MFLTKMAQLCLFGQELRPFCMQSLVYTPSCVLNSIYYAKHQREVFKKGKAITLFSWIDPSKNHSAEQSIDEKWTSLGLLNKKWTSLGLIDEHLWHTWNLSILGHHHTIKAKKCINSWQNSQNGPKFGVFYAKRGGRD